MLGNSHVMRVRARACLCPYTAYACASVLDVRVSAYACVRARTYAYVRVSACWHDSTRVRLIIRCPGWDIELISHLGYSHNI